METIRAVIRNPVVSRPRSELIAENALLRQQLIVLLREIKRPTLGDGDRILSKETIERIMSMARDTCSGGPRGSAVNY